MVSYVFDSALNIEILHQLLDIKESAFVVTMKNLVPLEKKVTGRNENSIEAIFTATEVMLTESFMFLAHVWPRMRFME
jgi:hypothetical protein